MKIMPRLVGASCAVVLATFAAPSAVAAPPEFERIEINETSEQEFLTEECGVSVIETAQGTITVRELEDPDGRLESVVNINVVVEVASEFGVVRGRFVQTEVVKSSPDGQVTLQSAGRVPGGFAGLLVIDLDSGEAIKEPQMQVGERQLESTCATLTGGDAN